MRHCNLPYHIYVNINNVALGPEMPAGTTRGILHGIYCRPGQAIMGHVLLESGAHWSGMLWHLISTSDMFMEQPLVLQPWGAMGEDMEAWHCHYLEGLVCSSIRGVALHGRHTGIIIDWRDGFSRYPDEHKPLNMVHLNGGQFALLPNNYLLFNDKHFVRPSARTSVANYRRNSDVIWGP